MEKFIAEIKQNPKLAFRWLLILFGFYVIVTRFKKIETWFKSLFSNISSSEVATAADKKNPTYVYDVKIIKNYVSQIVHAVDQMGTDEKSLDEVYKNFKNTSPENTILLWNEFSNYLEANNLSYSSTLGGFYKYFFGSKATLYDVLKSELTNNQNEKNVLTNYSWLFRRAGLI